VGVSAYRCEDVVYLSSDRSEADVERERSLIEQWVCLTEERNAVLVPTAGSGIPGAPADWYDRFQFHFMFTCVVMFLVVYQTDFNKL